MGSWISTAKRIDLPLKRKNLNEEFVRSVIDSKTAWIQTSKTPSDEDLHIVNAILKERQDIPFRVYGFYGEDVVDLSFLNKLTNVKRLEIDTYQDIINFDCLYEFDLIELSLGIFKRKDYSFIKELKPCLEELSIDLDDKNRNVDIEWLTRFPNLKNLGIRNVTKNISALKELKSLKSLSLRSIKIQDYSFLQDMKVKNLHLYFQNPAFFDTFGQNENIEYLELWRNSKLTDLSFLLQFPSLKTLVITDQSKIETIPDLKPLKNLKNIYFFGAEKSYLQGLVNKGVRIHTYYNPADGIQEEE